MEFVGITELTQTFQCLICFLLSADYLSFKWPSLCDGHIVGEVLPAPPRIQTEVMLRK